jgi:diguanylate cyclase (GGDEF)-like protein
VSPTLQSIFTALGGVLAGLALAGGLLWRQTAVIRQARYDATHDDTTGLPNRRLLRARLHQAITAGDPFGLVLLDLDGFKDVNDTFGHENGNDLLAEVGHRLRQLRGPVRLAARLSGDEFALLVAGDPDVVAAAARAAWRTIGTTPVLLDTATVTVRASVGFTCARLGVTSRQLLTEADEAMYQAKRDGTGVQGHHPNLPRPGRSRDRHHH